MVVHLEVMADLVVMAGIIMEVVEDMVVMEEMIAVEVVDMVVMEVKVLVVAVEAVADLVEMVEMVAAMLLVVEEVIIREEDLHHYMAVEVAEAMEMELLKVQEHLTVVEEQGGVKQPVVMVFALYNIINEDDISMFNIHSKVESAHLGYSSLSLSLSLF